MKALEISKIGFSHIVDAEVPEIKYDEVLIKVGATGICASDIASYLGKHPFRTPPLITGHETAGIVEAAGAGVKNLKPGDHVVIEPQTGCGNCSLCKSGNYNLCKKKRLFGTPKWMGGFAEYAVVPESCAFKIADDIPYDEATLMEPLSVALHAVGKSNIDSQKTVAILGTGTIGLMLVVACVHAGVSKIICSDIKQTNLEYALSLGATDVLNPLETNIVDKVLSQTDGEGVDISFVAVGSDAILNDAIKLTKPKGKIIAVGNFNMDSNVNMPWVQLFEREIIGTAMYNCTDYNAAIKMYPEVCDSLRKFITHRIKLEELPEVLDDLANKRMNDALKVIVIFHD